MKRVGVLIVGVALLATACSSSSPTIGATDLIGDAGEGSLVLTAAASLLRNADLPGDWVEFSLEPVLDECRAVAPVAETSVLLYQPSPVTEFLSRSVAAWSHIYASEADAAAAVAFFDQPGYTACEEAAATLLEESSTPGIFEIEYERDNGMLSRPEPVPIDTDIGLGRAASLTFSTPDDVWTIWERTFVIATGRMVSHVQIQDAGDVDHAFIEQTLNLVADRASTTVLAESDGELDGIAEASRRAVLGPEIVPEWFVLASPATFRPTTPDPDLPARCQDQGGEIGGLVGPIWSTPPGNLFSSVLLQQTQIYASADGVALAMTELDDTDLVATCLGSDELLQSAAPSQWQLGEPTTERVMVDGREVTLFRHPATLAVDDLTIDGIVAAAFTPTDRAILGALAIGLPDDVPPLASLVVEAADRFEAS